MLCCELTSCGCGVFVWLSLWWFMVISEGKRVEKDEPRALELYRRAVESSRMGGSSSSTVTALRGLAVRYLKVSKPHHPTPLPWGPPLLPLAH